MFFKKKLQRVQDEPELKDKIKKQFDLFIKHKIYWRVSILLFLVLALSCIFSFKRIILTQDFKIGAPAKEDVYMSADVVYIDHDLTKQKIEQAEQNIYFIYDIDINLIDDVSQELELFFNYLVKGSKSYEEEDFLSDYMSEHFWNILQDAVLEDKSIIKTVKGIQYKIMRMGVITDYEKYQLVKVNYKLITLRDLKDNTEKEFPVDKLINERALQKLIKAETREKFKRNIRLRYAVEDLLDAIIKPNIVKNEEEYNVRKSNIKNKLEPVYRNFLKGDLILRKGERVSEYHLNIIKEMYSKSSRQASLYSTIAVLVIVLLSIFVGIGFAKRFYPAILYNWKLVFIFSIVLIVMSILIRFFQYNYFELLVVPVVMGAMLLTILSNAVAGMIMVIVLSIYVMISSQDITVIGSGLICGVISIFLVYRVGRRIEIIRSGIIVGLASAVIILSLNLFWQGDIAFLKFWKNSLISFGSIFAGALLIIAILPLFQHLFKITTNIRLLELADENHPLLKKLVEAAPGTYHHSFIVSRLAEDAAKAIGCNAILAKVGALYHDIGKINKPDYFIENYRGGKGKHEKLTPNMSSLVIIAHVKDGYELAQKYNLGEEIEHIIRGHHGSGLMYFFYKKAVQGAGGDEEISEDKFRYPGPKPHSKECAIIMLADSIEAASRALEDPTASRIKGLIKRVIDDKFIDEQLIECSLTLKDLSKIEASFLKVMTGVFHQRIEYPK